MVRVSVRVSYQLMKNVYPLVRTTFCTVKKCVLNILLDLCTCLKVPPAVKKRDRPKGHNLTTVGLSAKKRQNNSGSPWTFSQLHTSEKVTLVIIEHPLQVVK